LGGIHGEVGVDVHSGRRHGDGGRAVDVALGVVA
jgi:hypothetical protein